MQILGALTATFGAGFLYFLTAIPGGVALGLPVWIAALAAWLGYSSGAVLVAYAAAPWREKLARKFKIEARPARPTFLHRAWHRFGLPALGLLGPVTLGPQLGAVFGLALGARRGPLVLALSFGALPCTVIFALLVSLGVKLTK